MINKRPLRTVNTRLLPLRKEFKITQIKIFNSNIQGRSFSAPISSPVTSSPATVNTSSMINAIKWSNPSPITNISSMYQSTEIAPPPQNQKLSNSSVSQASPKFSGFLNRKKEKKEKASETGEMSEENKIKTQIKDISNKANKFLKASKWDEALANLEQIKILAAKINWQEAIQQADNTIQKIINKQNSEQKTETGDKQLSNQQSTTTSQTATTSSASQNDDKQIRDEIKEKGKKAKELFKQKNWDATIEICNEVKDLAIQIKWNEVITQMNDMIKKSEEKRSIPKNQPVSTKPTSPQPKVSDPDEAIKTEIKEKGNTANGFLKQKEWQKAYDLMQEVLSLAMQIDWKDAINSTKKTIAKIEEKLQEQKGKPENIEPKKATQDTGIEEIKKEIKEKGNIANGYLKQKEWIKALNLMEEVLRLAESIQWKEAIETTQKTIGKIKDKISQEPSKTPSIPVQKAEDRTPNNVTVSTPIKTVSSSSVDQIKKEIKEKGNIANDLLKQKEWQKAYDLLKEVLDLATQINWKEAMETTQKTLIKIESKLPPPSQKSSNLREIAEPSVQTAATIAPTYAQPPPQEIKYPTPSPTQQIYAQPQDKTEILKQKGALSFQLMGERKWNEALKILLEMKGIAEELHWSDALNQTNDYISKVNQQIEIEKQNQPQLTIDVKEIKKQINEKQSIVNKFIQEKEWNSALATMKDIQNLAQSINWVEFQNQIQPLMANIQKKVNQTAAQQMPAPVPQAVPTPEPAPIPTPAPQETPRPVAPTQPAARPMSPFGFQRRPQPAQGTIPEQPQPTSNSSLTTPAPSARPSLEARRAAMNNPQAQKICKGCGMKLSDKDRICSFCGKSQF